MATKCNRCVEWQSTEALQSVNIMTGKCGERGKQNWKLYKVEFKQNIHHKQRRQTEHTEHYTTEPLQLDLVAHLSKHFERII